MFYALENLISGYGKKRVLHDVSININEGEIVSLIGHNGAGKSTTLKTAFGLIKAESGKISLDGKDLTKAPPSRMLEEGIFHLPQENFVFKDLDVRSNLELGLFTDKKVNKENEIQNVYKLFPILKKRERQVAGTLSGGERRLLGIAMGLLRKPKLLLIDEPSSGLSPIAFRKVLDTIIEINRVNRTAIFLVEQNVKSAFKVSNRVYVMKAGSIILEETGACLLKRESWWDLF